jgi:hypothetical protein
VANEATNPNQPGSGLLQISIAVDTTGYYEPLGSAPPPEIGKESPVTEVLDQHSTAWPGDLGEQVAVSAIGDKIGLGRDPRAQYYSTSAAVNNAGTWAARAAQVDRLKYAQDFTDPSFTATDFDNAKKELTREMDWVGNVDNYLTALAMPFNDAQKNLWAYFNFIQDQVNSSTQNGQTAAVTATILETLSSILEIAGGFGHAVHTVSAAVVGAYHIVLAYSDIGRAENEPFSTEAAKLAVAITDRLDVGARQIQDQWRNIIVADYGKLSTVGSCTRPQTNSCENPDENNDGWHITNADQRDLGNVMKLGVEKELYQTLVPVKYPQAMALGYTTEQDFRDRGGASGWCPPIRPFSSGTGAYIQSSSAGRVLPIVLADNNGDNPMSQAVFDRMFNPVNTVNPYAANAGLGINERDYLSRTYGIENPENPPRWKYSWHYAKYAFCIF